MDNLVGKQLGQYQIIAPLGQGGMASVYKASQQTLKRDIAIKVIEIHGDTSVKRFEREAQIIASLSHPHILPVFDYGSQDGFAYLVMKIVRGGSLGTLLAQGQLPLNQVDRILTEIADALDYAHLNGVVHRDLKPHNILLDEDGSVLLADFGVAKLLNETSDLTQSGALLGTPAYMAPEQWRGDPVDARTDIYALGIILFEMLVGRQPFEATTPHDAMHKHLDITPPALRDFRPDLPGAVQSVLDRALAKDREKRIHSAGDFAIAFRNAIQRKNNIQTTLDDNSELSAPPVAAQRLGQNPVRHDFYKHIALPPNYVPRLELLAELREQLIEHVRETLPSGGHPIALHGMGGIGKSVSARALCNDPIVQAAFPDGILWTTLGQNPNISAKLREWISALDGTISETAPTEDMLKTNLAGLLEKRNCLLIVDDVWLHTHAETFLTGGAGCQLVFTTRDAEIARQVGATIQPVPTMTEPEAMQLLGEWAGGVLTNVDPTWVKQIVNRLGRLPLALKLAGAQLIRKLPADWLRAFDVRKLKSKRPEGDIHDSLEQTFGLSLDALGKSERRVYAALAIFREDENIPESGIIRLWAGFGQLDDDETGDLLDDLAARALLQLAKSTYPRAIVLHDLLREFMAVELGDERIEAHRAIIEVYRHTQVGSGWHTAPDDGYLYDHLVYHLDALRSGDEIQGLFANQGWLNARVPANDYTYNGYISDLETAWDDVSAAARRQIDEGSEPIGIVGCMRLALIRTSINSLAGNYKPELIAQAVKIGLWSSNRAVSIAAHIPDPDLRAKMFTSLLATGKLSVSEYERSSKVSLDSVFKMRYESAQIEQLSALLPYLNADLVRDAITVIRGIDNVVHRINCFAAVAGYLPDNQRSALVREALSLIDGIEKDEAKIEAIAMFVSDLTGDEREQWTAAGLALIAGIQDDLERLKALTQFVPYLTGDEREQWTATGLALTATIQDDLARFNVLAQFVPLLAGEQQLDVLKTVIALAHTEPKTKLNNVDGTVYEGDFHLPGSWHNSLEVIAPFLLPEMQKPIWQLALDLAYLPAPTELVTYMSGDVFKEISESVHEVDEDSKRSLKLLTTIIPRLPDNLRVQALDKFIRAADSSLSVKDMNQDYYISLEMSIDEMLKGLLPTLTRSEVDRIWGSSIGFFFKGDDIWTKIISQLTREEIQTKLVSALDVKQPYLKTIEFLSPNLTPKTISQWFGAIEKGRIGDRFSFWSDPKPPLATIGPYLTQLSMIEREKAIALASSITDSLHRAHVMLTFELPEELRAQVVANALDATLSIKTGDTRADALLGLIPQVSRRVLEQTIIPEIEISLQMPKSGDDIMDGIIGDENYNAGILTILASHLDSDQREPILQRAISFSLSSLAISENADSKDFYEPKGNTLLRLFQLLNSADRLRILDSVLSFGDDLRLPKCYILANVFRDLTDDERDHFLEHADSFNLMTIGIKFFDASEFIPYINEDNYERVLEWALEDRQTLDRIKIMSMFMPFLKDALREEMFTQALNEIKPIEDEKERVKVLEMLAHSAAGEHVTKCRELTQGISNPAIRAVGLAGFLSMFEFENDQTLIQEVRRSIVGAFQSNQQQQSDFVLKFCAEEGLFTPPILSASMLDRIASNIIEICAEWQWL